MEKGVLGRYGVPSVNDSYEGIHGFCASSSLSVANMYCKCEDVHRYTWYRLREDRMGKRV